MLKNIPTERLEQVVRYADEHKEKAGAVMGLKEDTIRRYRNELVRRNEAEKVGALKEKKESAETIETVMCYKQYTTAEEMAKDCRIDMNVWYAYSICTNQWGTESAPSWQFKVLWKRKCLPDINNLVELFQKNVQNYIPKKHAGRVHKSGSKMLEISVPDLHLGRLAWDKESGAEYTAEIARREWINAHLYFYKIIKDMNIAKVVIPVGNDFFNTDTLYNTTTKGTWQPEDGRWQKTFATGCEACVDIIDMWLGYNYTVDILMVPGNHDTQRIFYLGMYLDAWYKNEHNVSIDNSPKTRKYYVWGRNLVGFSHGDKDYKRLRSVYQSEMREVLSVCDNMEWHVGHTHGEHMIEDFGSVVIRTIPSLAQKSSWESEMGYHGNRRAQAFVWDTKEGLSEIIYYTPDMKEKNV